MLRYAATAYEIEAAWGRIATAYNSRSRHYHNLTHLWALFNELSPIREHLDNYDAILFALFYHDIVYSTHRKDNESRSAIAAARDLELVQVPEETVIYCKQHILATAGHERSENDDTNYFMDADLSILGQSPAVYFNYCTNIRKEYAVIPDFLYKRGRAKVIRHFVQMHAIYKTTHFYNLYESRARENLLNELEELKG